MSKPIEVLLQEAIDSDPGKELNALWEVIDALAEAADVEVPVALTNKTIVLELTARFPAHGEFERELIRRIHEVVANEYMAGAGDLMGYDGPLVERLNTRLEANA